MSAQSPSPTTSESSAPQPVASLIGSYELLGQLARGGMGTVYVARRAGVAGFQRLFAIKVIHEHLADSQEYVEMFLDEARLAARLHHSNVVAIVDVGQVDGRQFVVMDYIEGVSLAYLLKKSRTVRPVDAIATIFSDFLSGLHAAHELEDDAGEALHLVHRDVSPANVLLGLDGVAKITDFGIAKAEARLTDTKTGMRKGKLAMMAPEQLLDEDVDRRVDVFAAGATLWSALTGEPLFRGSNDAATTHNILHLEVPPPSERGLKPPPVFDAICLKALERNKDDRYATAAEMADDIRRAATEVGLTLSAAKVADWLNDVASTMINKRKKAISAALAGEASTSDDVSVLMVGETPSHSHYSLSGMGFGATGISNAPSMPTPAPVVVKAEGNTTRWLAIALAFMVAIALYLALKSNDPPAGATLPQAGPPASTPAAPTLPASVDGSQTDPNGPNTQTGAPTPTQQDQDGSNKSTEDDTPKSKGSAEKSKTDDTAPTPGPSPRRFPPPRTAPPNGPNPAPKPAPIDAYPEPAPKPKPAPPSDPSYEQNPYLRGSK